MHRSLLRTATRLARLLIVAGLLFSLFTQDMVSQTTASAPADVPTHQPELVKDIQTMNGWSAPSNFTQVGDSFYFIANDGIHGYELWISQGASETTRLVKDLVPGSQSGAGTLLAPLGNDRLIFISQDNNYRFQLFVSDGTDEGTQQITHLTGFNPQQTVSLDEYVYVISGTALWRTDGSEAGTVQVTSMPLTSTTLAAFNGWLYFAATGPLGKELYRTKPGVPDPVLVKDMCPMDVNCGSSLGDADPTWMAAASDRVYFVARDETHGRAIWYTVPNSDAADSVTLFLDLTSGPTGTDGYSNLTPAGSGLYFTGGDKVPENKLWYFNGTPESLHSVANLNPGLAEGGLSSMVSLGSALFFSARSIYPGGYFELYRATSSGIVKVCEALKNVEAPIRVGSTLFFEGTTTSNSTELWQVNEDGLPLRITSYRPDYLSTKDKGAWNNKLVFSAGDPIHGMELWISDGTVAGTQMLVDINTHYLRSPEIPDLTAIYKGAVYFNASSGFEYDALWRSDGTEAGTQRVIDPNNFSSFGSAGLFDSAVSHDLLYFRSGLYSGSLWRTDGTEKGTEQLFKGVPRRFVAAGDRVFFISSGENDITVGLYVMNKGDSKPTLVKITGYGGDWQLGALGDEALLVSADQGSWELTRTDGTSAGTRRIYGPISPSNSGGTSYGLYNELDDMVAFDGRLFFDAPVLGGGAMGLYATDGETVTPITSPQGVPTYPINPVVSGDSLYFGGMRGMDTVLWRVPKGSSEAQIMHTTAANLTAYNENRIPLPIGDMNGRLVFRADKPGDGSLLWLSDGTLGGTVPICPACGYKIANSQRAVAAQGKIYFPASDTQGKWGSELWVSDGTDAGTHLLADINPGPASSDPSSLLLLGSRLLFVANDGLDSAAGGHGYELWRYNLDSTIYMPAVQKQ